MYMRRRSTVKLKVCRPYLESNQSSPLMVGMGSADLPTFRLSGERSTAELHSNMYYESFSHDSRSRTCNLTESNRFTLWTPRAQFIYSLFYNIIITKGLKKVKCLGYIKPYSIKFFTLNLILIRLILIPFAAKLPALAPASTKSLL